MSDVCTAVHLAYTRLESVQTSLKEFLDKHTCNTTINRAARKEAGSDVSTITRLLDLPRPAICALGPLMTHLEVTECSIDRLILLLMTVMCDVSIIYRLRNCTVNRCQRMYLNPYEHCGTPARVEAPETGHSFVDRGDRNGQGFTGWSIIQ